MDDVPFEGSDHTAEDVAPRYSESAIALDFAERHACELRYVSGWGKWMRWSGSVWRREETLLANDLAHAICREVARDIKQATNRSPKPIASAKTVRAVVELARADRRLAATVDQWDGKPWLLNTPAGVIDLLSGERRPPRPEDYMTKSTAVAPDPACSIKTWRGVLARAMGGDDAMVAYLQRLFGYCLTGSTREETLHFFYGPGANGKTKIVEAVAGCMGEYAASTPMETFLASRFERHPTELAALNGARMVTAVETDEGRSWDEAKIKMLTGGDKVDARFMRQDFFSFTPQFTIIIHGNHKPRLRTIDEAIKRRMHLVPFDVTIPKEERDLKLGDKLKGEWPGILNWMIEGCRLWQECGLDAPGKVTEATQEYLENQDVIGHWIEDRCIFNPNATEPRTDLFKNWALWAKTHNEFVIKQADFFEALEKRGCQQVKIKGVRRIRGLRLADTIPELLLPEERGEFVFDSDEERL